MKSLYDLIEPFEQAFPKVSHTQTFYFEQCGNPLRDRLWLVRFKSGLLGLLILSCLGLSGATLPVRGEPGLKQAGSASEMHSMAESYVKLALAVGQHDSDYVDAYYGPDAWQQEAKARPRSL